MGDKRKICVVDDEKHIVELLVMSLRQNGYDTCTAADGDDAITRELPDLVLLDLMLPGMSGLEVCRVLRQNPDTAELPVIMLTAKSEESDKVIGLGIGADDYVTKPFGIRELLARIEVVLRRVRPVRAPQPPRHARPEHAAGGASNVVRAGCLTIDSEGHTVHVDGDDVALSPTEFELLAMLADSNARTVKREELERETGVSEGGESGRALDVHIRNLRRKIGSDEPGRPVIETVRGIGYKIHA